MEPPDPRERDKKVEIPLDPIDALKALLKVDPDSEPAGDDDGANGPVAE